MSRYFIEAYDVMHRLIPGNLDGQGIIHAVNWKATARYKQLVTLHTRDNRVMYYLIVDEHDRVVGKVRNTTFVFPKDLTYKLKRHCGETNVNKFVRKQKACYYMQSYREETTLSWLFADEYFRTYVLPNWRLYPQVGYDLSLPQPTTQEEFEALFLCTPALATPVTPHLYHKFNKKLTNPRGI